jgi:hypothetical protein
LSNGAGLSKDDEEEAHAVASRSRPSAQAALATDAREPAL